MDIQTTDDAVTRRIRFFTDREKRLRENDLRRTHNSQCC